MHVTYLIFPPALPPRLLIPTAGLIINSSNLVSELGWKSTKGIPSNAFDICGEKVVFLTEEPGNL
jgi:hypothetical protein